MASGGPSRRRCAYGNALDTSSSLRPIPYRNENQRLVAANAQGRQGSLARRGATTNGSRPPSSQTNKASSERRLTL